MNRLNCILMVDDDRVSNFITENVIRSVGAASMINIVSDGMAALDYINYQCGNSTSNYACPDLIILDINMRLMNGIEFMRELNELAIGKKIPVVVLSSVGLNQKEQDELKKLGVLHFYVKPLSAEHLLQTMDDLFEAA